MNEGPNFMEWGSRFLNELLPWGDTSKGLWAGKRDAMVQKCVSTCWGRIGPTLSAARYDRIGAHTGRIITIFWMMYRYMEKTGCSLAEAEKEVDEYLSDKESYIIRKRAEEERAKKGK